MLTFQLKHLVHPQSTQHYPTDRSERETVPLLTSDMGEKTVSFLAHNFFLSQRANLGYKLSISPLRYSRNEDCAEAYVFKL